jgi:hypothetical protein
MENIQNVLLTKTDIKALKAADSAVFRHIFKVGDMEVSEPDSKYETTPIEHVGVIGLFKNESYSSDPFKAKNFEPYFFACGSGMKLYDENNTRSAVRAFSPLAALHSNSIYHDTPLLFFFKRCREGDRLEIRWMRQVGYKRDDNVLSSVSLVRFRKGIMQDSILIEKNEVHVNERYPMIFENTHSSNPNIWKDWSCLNEVEGHVERHYKGKEQLAA